MFGCFSAAGCLGLLNKTALAVGVGDELGREDLQGDLAVELQVEGLVDNPHPATADLFEDLVVGEALADHRAILLVAILSGTGERFNQPRTDWTIRSESGEGRASARAEEMDSWSECLVHRIRILFNSFE